jgi:hypothetical protein
VAGAIVSRRRWPFATALLALAGTLVVVFSMSYWQIGSARDFGTPLTRVDAMYFTVGTLSTAGTGNLSAISERARKVQTLQMGLDLFLLVVGGGVIVARYTSRHQATKSVSASSQASPDAQSPTNDSS